MTGIAFRGFGGVQLAGEVSGDLNAPPILLVHGAGQTCAVWRETAEMLVGAGRRVVRYDLRGHGQSEWPADGRYEFDAHVEDLRAVLAQMGARPVVVAATLGGWIAMAALAEDAPALAAGLVLVDMPARSEPRAASSLGAALKRRAQAPDSPFDPRAFAGMPLDAIADRLAIVAPSIRIPTLFLRGALSRLDRASDAEALTALFPDAEARQVADAEMLVVEDRLEAFNALLLEFLERKQPRAPAEYRAGSDPRTLRDALGCFATGVTVVTAVTDEGIPIGLTANSFTSVSLDPPLLLVCIANSAGSAAILRAAPHFGVNVLQIGQQPLSSQFAAKREDRFAGSEWRRGETDVPVLAGSLGAFECRRHAVHEGGDHFILVGEVIRAEFEPRRDPLLFFRGKYRRLHFA